MYHICLIGPFAQKTGYAQAFHDYALALHRTGVSVEIMPSSNCRPDDLEERYAELLPLVKIRETPSHVVVHSVPAYAEQFVPSLPEDAIKIVLTTWETDHLPEDLEKSLHEHYDEIIVPSKFCQKAIEGSTVVPHTFDPEHWPLQETPPDDSPFVFYSILGWSERKNPIGLLKAYLHEFSADDDVILRLKVSGYSREDLAALALATNVPATELPEVDIVTDYLDHEEILEMHHDSHVFVSAARGEGWNLPAFEAAILGNTVIAPTWGGQTEFLDGYGDFHRVLCFLTPAISPPAPAETIEGTNIRMARQNAPSGITARQAWAEPDLVGMGKIMRKCYENRWPKNMQRQRFIDHYGYGTVGPKLRDAILNTKRKNR